MNAPDALPALTAKHMGRLVDAGLPGSFRVEGRAGLQVRIGKRGATVVFRYRLSGSRLQRELRLGHWPGDDPAAMLDAWAQYRERVGRGDDPAAFVTDRVLVTWGEVLGLWSRHSVAASAPKRKRSLELTFGHLANHPMRRVTPQMIEAALAERPRGSARDGDAYARTLCTWALAHGYIDQDPMRQVARRRIIPRSVYPSIDYIRCAWRAAASLPDPLGAFARFQLLTAARAEEVAGARWGEFDLKAGLWTLPANRAKAGREHVFPLPDAALEVLRSVQLRDGRRQGVVFIGPRGGAVSAAQRRRIMDHFRDAALAAGIPMPDKIITHDFRRAMGRTLHSAGLSREVIHAALNHGAVPKGSILDQTYISVRELQDTAAAAATWAGLIVAPENPAKVAAEWLASMKKRLGGDMTSSH